MSEILEIVTSCPKCGKNTILLQTATWSAPYGKCSCGQEMIAFWRWNTGEIKIVPISTEPPTLGINVSDRVEAKDKLV